MVVCDEPMDVSAALRTLRDVRGNVSVVHTSDADDLAGELADSGRPVIVGPYSFNMTQRTMSGAATFASAGVPVVFAGEMPERTGDGLRITAALAVRHGLDEAKARLAMTATAAAVAGVDDRVGAVQSGLDADLVVFSDDPLRLDSKVLEVYVDGVRVFAELSEGESSVGGGS
jgi:imidazolonepropionase-like amidohydrolase